MALLLGIDLGTSYFKIGLFDEGGTLRGLGRVAVTWDEPGPGRSELAVEVFWRLLRRGLGEALAEAGAAARDIAALSYSSQATTFLLLDRADRPLTPLVAWTDLRGAPVEPALADFARSERFRRAIGFAEISGQTAAAKLRWFQREQPRVWADTRRVMSIADYFTFALTGEAAGDASTAAFLALYDLPGRRWWPDALTAFGVEAAQLSTPLTPGTASGRTSARAEELLGVPRGIPFAVGALDHHAAAIGSGLGSLGDVSISTGTVLAALVLVDDAEPTAGCYHGRHTDGRRCYRLAFDANGAGQVEELQKQIAPALSIADLLNLAGESDHPVGRAVRELLTRIAETHARLVRVTAGGGDAQRVIATGGGSRSPHWVQINADVLGVPVVVPACIERACLGAALFAAVAGGWYATVDEATQVAARPGRVFRPGEKWWSLLDTVRTHFNENPL
ncbi:MAG: FGGY-family carbohydrate kinase [Verrucomicrobia bacterium]|nr:FGGY-family carbohydrate kinase [Verrucomicrobiota bacterium]